MMYVKYSVLSWSRRIFPGARPATFCSTFFHLQDLIQAAWWCNNHLEKYEFVNGKDYPIQYMNIYIYDGKETN